jgi:Flp pilus assembly protein TadD
MPASMAEHWLYLPLLGLGWALAYAFERVPVKPLLAGASLVAALFGLRVLARTYDYRDGFTLYQRDIEQAPNSFLLHTNLGAELYRRRDLAGAESHFAAAVRLMPDYPRAKNNLAVVYAATGRVAAAERLYREAIESGRDSLAYQNLAELLRREGHHAEAAAILREGLRYYPYDETLRALIKVDGNGKAW